MDKKTGWQYLECICDNFTQADNLDKRLRKEGWLFTEVQFEDIDESRRYIIFYKKRIYYSPGWYVTVTSHGVREDEYGPFLKHEDAEEHGICTGDFISKVEYHGIEKPWETRDRFETIGYRKFL